MIENSILGVNNSALPKVYDGMSTLKTETSGNLFEDMYNASINMVEDTNTYQKEATQLQLDFATGKTDDILAVTLAQENAYTTLNFTVQVVNRVMAAYKEIMQIQL